jgi:hypothetical protein
MRHRTHGERLPLHPARDAAGKMVEVGRHPADHVAEYDGSTGELVVLGPEGAESSVESDRHSLSDLTRDRQPITPPPLGGSLADLNAYNRRRFA